MSNRNPGKGEGDIVNCERALGNLGDSARSPYASCSMKTFHYVPLGTPISTSGPSVLSMSPNRTFRSVKSNFSSPLAAAQPLNVLSRPETLNASGSRRACRSSISRNARSLPDFPGFAHAVRYGVPGTPESSKRLRYKHNPCSTTNWPGPMRPECRATGCP